MTKKMKFDKSIKSDSKLENESYLSYNNNNNSLILNTLQSEITVKDNSVDNKKFLIKVYEPKKIESQNNIDKIKNCPYQEKKIDIIENIENNSNIKYSVKYFEPTTQNKNNFSATNTENHNNNENLSSFKKDCQTKDNDKMLFDKNMGFHLNFTPKNNRMNEHDQNNRKETNKFIKYFHQSKEKLNEIFEELDDNPAASNNTKNSNSFEKTEFFQKSIDNQEIYKKEITPIIIENSENKLINSEINSIGINQTSFQKENFKLLKIIGQFNLGFIITYSAESNQIFIIDQHAADEKTNYEKLMKNYKFQSQLLITPLNLNHLTQLELHTLKNNPTIFEKNGFSLDFKKDSNSNNETQDIYLKALPCFKNVQFDLNDFYELLRNIQNNESYSEEAMRPRKVQTSIAFKACRGSKMIGDSLSLKDMEIMVYKLAELQSPWNCPHGRPTMIKSESLSNILQKIQFKRFENCK